MNSLYYVDGGIIDVLVEYIDVYPRYEQERAFVFASAPTSWHACELFRGKYYDFERTDYLNVIKLGNCPLESQVIEGELHDVLPEELADHAWEVVSALFEQTQSNG